MEDPNPRVFLGRDTERNCSEGEWRRNLFAAWCDVHGAFKHCATTIVL